jgi:DNA-binding NarL/FixJ family response regulator
MPSGSSSEIRVCLVESNKVVSKALEAIFAGTPGFSCVGVISNAEDALRLLPSANPQVAVVGLALPGIGGLECICRLRVKLPRLQFIALSHFQQPELLFDAIKAGVAACVLTPVLPMELIDAVEIVHQGGSWVPPYLARWVFQYFQKMVDVRSHVPDILTCREREILLLAKHGLSNKQIADRLIIKYDTARTHIRNIYGKPGVRSRGEAVAKYFRL